MHLVEGLDIECLKLPGVSNGQSVKNCSAQPLSETRSPGRSLVIVLNSSLWLEELGNSNQHTVK